MRAGLEREDFRLKPQPVAHVALVTPFSLLGLLFSVLHASHPQLCPDHIL